MDANPDILTGLLHKYHKDPILRYIVKYINEVETKTEKALEPNNKLQGLLSQMISGGKRINLTEKGIEVIGKDAKKIRISSLSSGEKQILRILIECLRVGESSLIIDEPEISLHVDWQKELIPTMIAINRDCQLIIATHSPEVVAPLGNEKLFHI